AGEAFDRRTAHLPNHHGGCRARNAPRKGPDRRGPHQSYRSHDRAHVNFRNLNMKSVQIMALAALAGLALITPFRSALAGNAVSIPQAAEKPCGIVTVAAASDLTYAMNEIVADFEKATGCTVRVSMGSSGNFL